MEKSYKKFEKNKSWSLDEFYFNLEPLEKRAVALGNLNYQVGNGGFTQWIDNNYASVSISALRFIMSEVDKLKKFPELKKALILADEVEHIETSSGSEFSKNAELYDKSFYSLKNLEKEMNAYLKLIKSQK